MSHVQQSSRRQFLKTASVAAGSLALSSINPEPLLADFDNGLEPVPVFTDDRVKALILSAIDFSRSQGVTYADARLSHTLDRLVGFGDFNTNDRVGLHASVRVLRNGYWGFSSGPVWGTDEMIRLAKEAFRLAVASSTGPSRTVDLGSISPTPNGTWATPISIDPLSIHPAEIYDYKRGLEREIVREAPLKSNEELEVNTLVDFHIQDRAFGSTDGSYIRQRIYLTRGQINLKLKRNRVILSEGTIPSMLDWQGLGWELFTEQPLKSAALSLLSDMRRDLELPVIPFDVGRYDAVLDSKTVAGIVLQTIGNASQLDRSLGYEANASGTSYLNDPFTMIRNFSFGTPQLTVMANRSEPGGAATVGWDDEGVKPQDFAIVESGVLQNFQLNREAAGWLRAASDGGSQSEKSFGCAFAVNAAEPPLIHNSNLIMKSGERGDVESLMAEIGNGVFIKGMNSDMDFQMLNGYGTGGRWYKVKDGKVIGKIPRRGLLFRTPEFWKSLFFIGGEESVRRYGLGSIKGEPRQPSKQSVSAVPVAVKDLAVIDVQMR